MDRKNMAHRKGAIELQIRRTMEALEKNNMHAYYADTSADAVQIVESLLHEGDTIACGGSITLDATGVKDLMCSGKYNFLNREAAKTDAERQKVYRDVFSADAFLTSSNAITEQGELYNVDGTGNRVAAMMFGPSKVIVVAGYNKIVRNLEAAVTQVKEMAAPANALRLHMDTPCSRATCPGIDGDMCKGCRSENRICSLYTVMGWQRAKDRIHVVLIGEEVGY